MKPFARTDLVGKLRLCFDLLTSADRKKLGFIATFQVVLAFLDLAGVACIGIVTSLGIRSNANQSPGDRVSRVMAFLHLDTISLSRQMLILGLASVFFLVTRTLLSVYFTKKTIFFLSGRAAEISKVLLFKNFSQGILGVKNQTTQKTIWALTSGVDIIAVGILATLVSLTSDLAVLVILLIGLAKIDLMVTVMSISILGIASLCLTKMLQHKAKNLGKDSSLIGIDVNELIMDSVMNFRELTVSNRRGQYLTEIAGQRSLLVRINSEISFLPYVSKYVIEIVVIISVLLVAGQQILFEDTTRAIATLSVFIVAGTRIGPAVLRLQQSVLQISGNISKVGPTLDLIEDLKDIRNEIQVNLRDFNDHLEFSPAVDVENLTFTYPGATSPALKDISFRIRPGEHFAIVGPSGSGKSTLIDLILGVLDPFTNSVKISNMGPMAAINSSPGAIAYVPQDVYVTKGTLAMNISRIHRELNSTEKNQLDSVLKATQLEDLVAELSQGIYASLGENGSRLSGGQRQRIGIARALFTNPRLVVLDEATSALDAETEEAISIALKLLHGEVTFITIAHRLSTVINSDRILYLEDGKMRHLGDFESLRQSVPEFDQQAKLMGL